ncbi:MAG: polymerase subunit delta [Verrucomicrobiota bacterium]|jgi:DNA polymerase-3 subunit delta
MPPVAVAKLPPVVLVCGDDDLAAKQRAREIFSKWSAELGGDDHEIIDANVTNSDGSLKAIARLREAMQTLPFFGGGKAIWFRDCNFLVEDRMLATKDVTETLAEVADELKKFAWTNVRLLISTTKADGRKAFYKTIQKLGTIEEFAGLDVNDKNWSAQAETLASRGFDARQKEIAPDALRQLIVRVGPNSRLLDSEVEKLSLHAGDRVEITLADVKAICIQNKTARAFALGDALGARDLPALLRCLDEELWEIRAKVDRDKSEIGLLYALISKIRVLILLKEMIREGWLKVDASYDQLKTQLTHVPEGRLPAEKKYNPTAMHPFVVFNTLRQTKNYTQAELIRAMELLLTANRQLVTSQLDEALVLQQTLARIVARPAAA